MHLDVGQRTVASAPGGPIVISLMTSAIRSLA
jgi:hypothetical protein